MTPERLAEIRERLNWGLCYEGRAWKSVSNEAVFDLLAEVDRLRAQVAAVEELMPYFSTMDYYGDEIVSQLERAGLRKPVFDD